MDSRIHSEQTPWQRSWPWLAGVFGILVQALSLTQLLDRLWPSWHITYLTPLLVLPLLGFLLVVIRSEVWVGPRLRWLRAAVVASTVVWLALSAMGDVLTGFRDAMKIGAGLKAAERQERGQPAPSRPPRYESLPQLPRLPQGWAFVFWIGISGIGTPVLKRLQDAKDEAASEFYRKQGFEPVLDDPLKLFLPVALSS